MWLDAELDSYGKVIYRADSDAIIVKGIISMLVEVLSGHTPDEILAADLSFIDKIGLAEHLSPTRSNGLLAMVKQMRAYALAFKAKDALARHNDTKISLPRFTTRQGYFLSIGFIPQSLWQWPGAIPWQTPL